MLAQREGQHVMGSLDKGIKVCVQDGERPGGYRACRNGGVFSPRRVAICSVANCERGLSLVSSFRIRRRAPLIARLD